MKKLLLLCFLPLCSATLDQAYAVKGRLMCGAKPAINVRVKLWEEDTGPDPDDLLDSGYTDSNGEFRLGGSTAELTPIDPVFKVYHDCDDDRPGKRKVKFGLPKSYITKGTVPKKDFDIGILNLETIFPKEERELILTRRRRTHHRDYQDDMEYDRHEEKSRHRRGGYNADYMDPDNIKENPVDDDDRITPTERPGRNPCL